MGNDFKKATNIIEYLNKGYKLKGKKHTINDDFLIIKNISNDHSLVELKIIENKIKALINLERDTNYMNKSHLSLMIAFFTAVSATVLGLVAGIIQLLILYANQLTNLAEEKFTLEDLFELVKSIDVSALMNLTLLFIVIAFLVVFVAIVILNSRTKKRVDNYYMYSILIVEAIEKKKEDSIKPKILLK